jgi:hypothetical protein
MAANYADGVWRYDTTTGWDHISNLQATWLDVDDAGDVYGKFSNGLWRWNAATASWGKLSDLTVSTFRVTASGILYGDFGSNGLWRWNPSTGWGQLTNMKVGEFTVSDSDVFYGDVSTGVQGTWRWTPTQGWSLLSHTLAWDVFSDSAGDLVADYTPGSIGTASAGTWRWTQSGGWARLSNAFPSNLSVSASGAIYETRDTGLWYLGVGQSAFTQISNVPAPGSVPIALPDGSVFYYYFQTSTPSGWYFNAATSSWAKVVDTMDTGFIAVGKDGDVFINDFSHGLLHWAPGSSVTTLSGTATFLISQRPGFID